MSFPRNAHPTQYFRAIRICIGATATMQILAPLVEFGKIAAVGPLQLTHVEILLVVTSR